MAVSKDNKRVSVKLSKKLNEQLERDASAENRSVSNYIEYLLEKLYAGKEVGK